MRALRALFIMLMMGAAAFAACPGGRFDVSIKEPIALKDALLSIVDECDISLSIEGEGTQDRFDSAKIGYVSLRAVSAEEALDFFLQRANLHHTIVNDVLTIRYLDSRLFRVDFVNNSRKGKSSADVKIGTSVGTGGSSSGGSSESSSDSSSSIQTEETFDLWGTLDKELNAILQRPEDGATSIKGGDAIVINAKSGLVTVTGTRRQLDRVSEYLDKTLSTLRKQVLIDAQIYEVILNDGHTSGIDWSALSLGFDTRSGNWDVGRLIPGDTENGYYYHGGWDRRTDNAHPNNSKSFAFSISGGWNANGFINFLKTQGEAKSLSSPKVLAMNNQPTLISVGRNLNYQTLSSTTLSGSSSGSSTQSVEQNSLFVGVLLDITAQIDEDGFVTLRLNPSISELLRQTDADVVVDASGIVPRRIAPDTMSRRISSVARVRDGDVVVLGGMIQNSNEVTENKVPLLGDIPFVGALFGSKKTSVKVSEIVFVLTPHIVSDEKDPVTLKKLGFSDTTIKSVNDYYKVTDEPSGGQAKAAPSSNAAANEVIIERTAEPAEDAATADEAFIGE
ncbi:pilus (MSHA type) biogenesis protein MshL [Campylobacterota bacterium]|nr:pilus (MSHA type) biogenesis protein MshL [Campylobacterota bacterium]